MRGIHLRGVLASTCLIAGFALTSASAGALAPGQKFGFGDQNSAPDVFNDVRLQAMKPTITRYVADFDVARKPSAARDGVDRWYATSLENKQRMLIAFGAFQRRAPSLREYRAGLKAFKERYPSVREWAPVNEANHTTQPTWRNPRLAVSYTKIARRVCQKCTIVQLTLLLGFKSDIRYAKKFKAALPRGERRRMIWALHTYGGTNRNNSKHLTRFLKTFRTGNVWFTESASWAQFAPPVWPYNLTRQANRTALVFRQAIAASRRVKRLYWYEWDGSTDRKVRWDSGLIDGSGKARPAYRVAKRERFRKRLTRYQLRQSGLADLARAARSR